MLQTVTNGSMLKRSGLIFGLAMLFWTGILPALTRYRSEFTVPDIPGYHTLKCDFHTHTVFSDGLVWPSVRAEEAWRDGLDAIAITDHIEYLPHKSDIPPDHERSFEIARPTGELLDIKMIKGSEITRRMPPGHLNAIFLTSSTGLDQADWRTAVQAAAEQGAFIFWNHPGWRGQQPDGRARWYPEHSELLKAGWLHGVEVVNMREYYPEAHQWCIDSNLTMLSNSDIHDPVGMEYHPYRGDHRPMTLVFATEHSIPAIHEALLAGRTAVYWDNKIAGSREFIEPVFRESLTLINSTINLQNSKMHYLQIFNHSDMDYQLRLSDGPDFVQVPLSIMLKGGKTSIMEFYRKESVLQGKQQVSLIYLVENLITAPETPLQISFDLEVILPDIKMDQDNN